MCTWSSIGRLRVAKQDMGNPGSANSSWTHQESPDLTHLGRGLGRTGTASHIPGTGKAQHRVLAQWPAKAFLWWQQRARAPYSPANCPCLPGARLDAHRAHNPCLGTLCRHRRANRSLQRGIHRALKSELCGNASKHTSSFPPKMQQNWIWVFLNCFCPRSSLKNV